jgi:indolepyruvate ferredoxin oxidoreductase alpha subunit
MGAASAAREVSTEQLLLGDESVALGAIHAGITAAYAYPGTPSTEILESLIRHEAINGAPKASWCANEKTAYEQALGVSFAGRRSLVAMKHVGLNVAADAFINSAIVSVNGGLVLAVADDPGMHSSQNEQDSRFYADFARVICLEPADQQEAYDMTIEAFGLSERFHIPVMIRLTTRLAHSRAMIRARAAVGERPLMKTPDTRSWILLPGNARKGWRALLDAQAEIRDYAETCAHNRLAYGDADGDLGVITSGIARNYFFENMDDMEIAPSHLHIGTYPAPARMVRALAARARRILVLEEGYPFIERSLRGMLHPDDEILGRESGHLPLDGELTPDLVRVALGLPRRKGAVIPGLSLPERPPQLCSGCPHRDTYAALKEALSSCERSVVTSDIGCYTLGALPPCSAIESCVCMGASVGMAKGASDAGLRPAVAVIGDSTFLHSGITPLIDAVASSSDMTLIILDNGTVAMTGMQPTALPSAQIESLVLGLGVPREHCRVLEPHPRRIHEMAEAMREEIAHPGVSVIICRRECVESARKRKALRR